MPIVARRTSDPSSGPSPSAVLLPADGVLASEARRLARRLDDPGVLPPAWSEAAFAREVALVRAHLAPIRSRAALAASFSREAFHTTPPGRAEDEAAGAVRVAYAIRWLELDEGRSRAPWPVAIRASAGVA